MLLWRLPEALQALSTRILDAGSWLFVLAWVAMAISMGMLWAVGLRALAGHCPEPLLVLQVQGGAWAGRYLPGKVGLLAGKVVLAGRDGLDVRTLGGSVLFEQFAFVAAGIALAAACIDPALVQQWRAFDGLPTVSGTALRGVGIAIALLLAIGAAWAAVRTAGTGRIAALAPVALLYLLPHAICGLGFAAMVRPTGIDLSLIDAIGAMALANVAGVVAVFAPAGLGVREAVLAAVLPPGEPTAILAIVVSLRILATAGDVVVIAIGMSAGALRRLGRRP